MGAATACSGVQKTEPSSQDPHATTVEIRNLKPVDFTVYVLTGTHRLRLGTAPGMTTRTFVIPPHLLHTQAGRMRFGLDVIGAFSFSGSGAFWSDSGAFGYESLAVHMRQDQNSPRTFGTQGRFVSTEVPLVRPGDQLSMTLEQLDPLNPVILRSIKRAGEEAVPDAAPTGTFTAANR